jgi:hypothetical protein
MRVVSIAVTLLLAMISRSFASDYYQDSVKFHHEWETAGSTWLERWTAMERRSSEMSDEEKIRRFSGILDAPVETLGAEEAAIYHKIRTMLLTTPGHATYYLDRWKENPKHPATRFMFQYFRNLPSPETIGVLGELLSDESPRPKLAADHSNIRAYMEAYPNCDKAVEVLTVLLQDPPTTMDNYSFGRDLVIWQQWYERVKAGRETFRLVGDPVDYTLRGPSKRGAVTPGPREGKRNAETGGEKPSPNKPLAEKPGYLPYLIGIVFLLAAVFLFLKGKRGGV